MGLNWPSPQKSTQAVLVSNALLIKTKMLNHMAATAGGFTINWWFDTGTDTSLKRFLTSLAKKYDTLNKKINPIYLCWLMVPKILCKTWIPTHQSHQYQLLAISIFFKDGGIEQFDISKSGSSVVFTGQDRTKDEAWTTGWKIYKSDL